MSKSQATAEGRRFQEARLSARLTLAQLAQRLGYSPGTISAVENGHDRPSARLRRTLIHGLLLNESWIASGEGAMFAVPPEQWDTEPGNAASPPSVDIAPGFGMRLRWIRRSQELTLSAFAANCGYDLSYISRLERGEAAKPSKDFIDAVCKAFGVTDGWLVMGEGDPSKEFITRIGQQRKDFPALQSLTKDELYQVLEHVRQQEKVAAAPVKAAYGDFITRVYAEYIARVTHPWKNTEADK